MKNGVWIVPHAVFCFMTGAEQQSASLSYSHDHHANHFIPWLALQRPVLLLPVLLRPVLLLLVLLLPVLLLMVLLLPVLLQPVLLLLVLLQLALRRLVLASQPQVPQHPK